MMDIFSYTFSLSGTNDPFATIYKEIINHKKFDMNERISLCLSVDEYFEKSGQKKMMIINGYSAFLISPGQFVDVLSSTTSSQLYWSATSQTQQITINGNTFTASVFESITYGTGYAVPYEDIHGSSYSSDMLGILYEVYTSTTVNDLWDNISRIYTPCGQTVYLTLGAWGYFREYPEDVHDSYYCDHYYNDNVQYMGKTFVLSDTVVQITDNYGNTRSAVTTTCVETGEIVYCNYYRSSNGEEYFDGYCYTGESTNCMYEAFHITHIKVVNDFDSVLRNPEPGVWGLQTDGNFEVLYNLNTDALYQIKVKYNVTQTGTPVQICDMMPISVEKAVLDGDTVIWNGFADGFCESDGDGGWIKQLNYGMSQFYTFETTGEHEIVYHTKSKTICNLAFYGISGLTDVEIGQGIETILYEAFQGCPDLTGITFPSSLKAVYSNVFNYDLNWQYINFNGTPDEWGQIQFSYPYSPDTSNPIYNFGLPLHFNGTILSDIVLTGKYKTFNGGTFSNCSSITSLTVCEGVEALNDAFKGCQNLVSVTLPSTITGHVSFAKCTSLSSVTLTEGMTNLALSGEAYYDATLSPAFCGCTSLHEITIPSSVRYIGPYAFYGCPLTSLTLPTSLMRVENLAFYGCSGITDLNFGPYINYIGSAVTSGCSSLTSITFDPAVWDVDVSPSAFTSHLGLLENSGNIYYLNDNIVYQVSYYSASSYTMKSTVKNICTSAFCGCASATSIPMPSDLVKIRQCAFYGCSKLTTLTLPDTVTYVGPRSFYSSPLTAITIGSGVTVMDCNDIKKNWYTEDGHIFTTNAKVLRSRFINNSSLDEVANNWWGALVYDDKYSTYLYVRDNVAILCTEPTGSSATFSVTIPNSVIAISGCCFSGRSKLTAVTIGTGVQEIGNEAFRQCTALKSVSIPDNVLVLGKNCFSGDTSLTSLTIGTGITEIPESCFCYCNKLTGVTIPGNVQKINYNAFYYCTSITSITFNSGLTEIGEQAFYSTKISGVSLPDTLITLGGYAFAYCSALSSITFGSSIETIGNYFCRNTSGITSLVIPDTVTSLGTIAYCPNLTAVTLGSGLTDLSNSTLFWNCPAVKSLRVYATTPPSSRYRLISGNVAQNGTLYYPSGSDYSDWLKNESGYFGYYGWTGQTF